MFAPVVNKEVDVHMGVAEPLENEAINIGELLAQSLAIAVTPWPRAPEAPEKFTSGEEFTDHPFVDCRVKTPGPK